MLIHVDTVNWAEQYPECPDVRIEVSNDHERICLHYYVHGAQLRAMTAVDRGPVWEDSCVEFFCQVPGEKHYCNFEANCIGAMTASRRVGRREDVQPLTDAELAMIERRCSLPKQTFEEQDGIFDWEVELLIPLRLIFRESAPHFPQVLRANFYKCADRTKKPHFLSWQPIELPKPDFHCPEFFGEIVLQ